MDDLDYYEREILREDYEFLRFLSNHGIHALHELRDLYSDIHFRAFYEVNVDAEI